MRQFPKIHWLFSIAAALYCALPQTGYAQEYCTDGTLDELALICGGGDGPDSWYEEIPVPSWEALYPITIYATMGYTDICVPDDLVWGEETGYSTFDTVSPTDTRVATQSDTRGYRQNFRKDVETVEMVDETLYPSTYYLQLYFDRELHTVSIANHMSWPVTLEQVSYSPRHAMCPDGNRAKRVGIDRNMQWRQIGVYYTYTPEQ